MGMVIAFQDWCANLTVGGEMIIVNQVPNIYMPSKTLSHNNIPDIHIIYTYLQHFNHKGPNTKNYEWADWEAWSDCSVSCGGDGTKTRTRACIPPSNGGYECPDSIQTETDTCNQGTCPGKKIMLKDKALTNVY